MEDAPPLVLVGVTGGIAAYKTCEVVRRLVEAGRDVRCALTPTRSASSARSCLRR